MMRLILFFTGFLFLTVKSIDAQEIVINEFMSSNETTLQDADGDYSDWIELYNRGEFAINLKDFMISDDTLEPAKWIFPEMTFPPKTFLVIFASDKNRHDTTELHTNFKIKDEGEYLLLSNPDGGRLDLMSPLALQADQSFGRFPDGEEILVFLGLPTPGSANNSRANIVFSKPAGFYSQPFKLALLTSNPFNTIYYTLDGSIPDISSLIYTDSIPITYRDNCPDVFSMIPTSPAILSDNFRRWYPPDGPVPKVNVIRAASFYNGVLSSPVFTTTYVVDSAINTNIKYPVVSVNTDSSNFFDFYNGIYIPGVFWDSLNCDWTGNYYQKGDEWERPAHLEYFEESGNRVINQDVGLRIHGKITRHAPQKTLRVSARSEYGNSYFNYPLMINSGQDKFKRFLLHSSYTDGSQTILKDVMIHDLVKHLNMDVMYYRPVTVFINGEYWGTQTIRDRIDQYYLGLKYDIEPDSIDILENNAQIEEGSNADYLDMLAYIQNNDLAAQEHYDYLKTRMDIDNYIDYQIVEIYFNNNDWPGSNVQFWRERNPGAKWRWNLFDLDNSFADFSFNTLKFVTYEGDTCYQNPTWATFLFRNLLKNDQFRSLFITRFAHLLNTTFRPDSVLTKIINFTQLYEKDIDRHISRWHFPRSHEGWISDINYALNRFAIERPCYMRDFILDYFNLEENEFDFNCNDFLPEIISNNFQIMPNPAATFFRLKITGSDLSDYKMSIFDEMGRRILQKEIPVIDGKIDEVVDISVIKNGIYFINVNNGRNILSKTLIKTSH